MFLISFLYQIMSSCLKYLKILNVMYMFKFDSESQIFNVVSWDPLYIFCKALYKHCRIECKKANQTWQFQPVFMLCVFKCFSSYDDHERPVGVPSGTRLGRKTIRAANYRHTHTHSEHKHKHMHLSEHTWPNPPHKQISQAIQEQQTSWLTDLIECIWTTVYRKKGNELYISCSHEY